MSKAHKLVKEFERIRDQRIPHHKRKAECILLFSALSKEEHKEVTVELILAYIARTYPYTTIAPLLISRYAGEKPLLAPDFSKDELLEYTELLNDSFTANLLDNGWYFMNSWYATHLFNTPELWVFPEKDDRLFACVLSSGYNLTPKQKKVVAAKIDAKVTSVQGINNILSPAFSILSRSQMVIPADSWNNAWHIIELYGKQISKDSFDYFARVLIEVSRSDGYLHTQLMLKPQMSTELLKLAYEVASAEDIWGLRKIGLHKNTPPEILEELAFHKSAIVRFGVARNVITPTTVLETLSGDSAKKVATQAKLTLAK